MAKAVERAEDERRAGKPGDAERAHDGRRAEALRDAERQPATRDGAVRGGLARGEPDGRVVEFARLEVAGYLGRDAQVVKTPEREFVSLSVGSTHSWRGPDQQPQERTVWTKVLVFGEPAEAFRDLRKGAAVYAVGPLTYDRWEDANGPRHAPVIRVTERNGEVQPGPIPGGQFTRVTVSGVIERAATVQHDAGDGAANRATARFGVQARGNHAVVVQGPLVSHIAERLGAGHGVRMEGRLELRRWQDAQGKPHERVMIVIGGPDSQIRVDREPIATPALAPEPKPLPTPELAAPAPMQAHERADRARR